MRNTILASLPPSSAGVAQHRRVTRARRRKRHCRRVDEFEGNRVPALRLTQFRHHQRITACADIDGDEAMKMVRTEAPLLAWLLPVSTAKPPPDDHGATAAAASSPQLERLELSLLVVRRSLEQLALMVEQLSAKQDQLAVKQDQMSHIAVLKSVEPPPQSRAVPPRKPPQPPTARSSATQSSSVPAPPPPTEQPSR